jgi:hypothetical protein
LAAKTAKAAWWKMQLQRKTYNAFLKSPSNSSRNTSYECLLFSLEHLMPTTERNATICNIYPISPAVVVLYKFPEPT